MRDEAPPPLDPQDADHCAHEDRHKRPAAWEGALEGDAAQAAGIGMVPACCTHKKPSTPKLCFRFIGFTSSGCGFAAFLRSAIV